MYYGFWKHGDVVIYQDRQFVFDRYTGNAGWVIILTDEGDPITVRDSEIY